MKCKLNILITTLTLTLSACGSVTEDNRILIENDSQALASRVTDSSTTINITAPSSKPAFAPNTSQPALTLVARVSSPKYKSQSLQATETRILGNKAYVAYNTQGEQFLGGLDIFDISDPQSPKLVSNLIMTDTDINGVSVHGTTLYAAAATSRSAFSTPAVLMKINLSGGLLTDEITEIDIKSFAATDVDVSDSHIYVTSGAEGGYITVLNRSTLAIEQENNLFDARGVDTGSNKIAVVSGANTTASTNAQLHIYDRTLGSIQNMYNVNGANIEFSKSTVELKGAVAVMGMGDGGVQLVCTTDGSVIDSISQPVLNGVDTGLTVSNAVTAFKRNLFISNGEAGVYLSRSTNVIHNNDCNIGVLNHLGTLSFGDSESVNHVVYRANTLLVAAGSGGLKILHVDDIDTDVTDPDDSI